MPIRYPEFSTMGFELEVENIVSGALPRIKIGNVTFNKVHDASCESDVMSAGPLDVYMGNVEPAISELISGEGGLNRHTAGTEYVSDPIDLENTDLLTMFKVLTQTLLENGESPASYRGSVHYHFSCPHNLQILKNIITLGRHLEDVFFYIGGQGYEFRGTKFNESQYCRPITKWGPQCVPIKNDGSDNGWGQLYNCDELLASQSTTKFWKNYGDTNLENLPRYFHVRYTWLNLYSLLVHGTLEFRVFNKTMNPHYLNAGAELCKKFTQLSVFLDNMRDYTDLEENSIYDGRSKSEIQKTFLRFAHVSNLSDYSTRILSTIIERTPEIDLPKRYVASHMLERSEWKFFTNSSPLVVLDEDEIVISPVRDIHALRNSVSEMVEESREYDSPAPTYRIDINAFQNNLREQIANSRRNREQTPVAEPVESTPDSGRLHDFIRPPDDED